LHLGNAAPNKLYSRTHLKNACVMSNDSETSL
jgi:hypothetical protein